AVDLGSLDLELEDVEATQAEPTANNAPTRAELPRATRLAKAKRRRETPTADDDVPVPGVGARFGRWLRRMTIRAVLILVVLGGAFYFARPHPPTGARLRIDGWLKRLPGPLSSRSGTR